MTSRRRFGRIRKLPSGRWQARYPDGSGGDIPAPDTFASKGDAARWLVMVEADMARGQYVDPRAGRITFSEWAEQWLRSPRQAGELNGPGSSGPRRVHAAPRPPSAGVDYPHARPGGRRCPWPRRLSGDARA